MFFGLFKNNKEPKPITITGKYEGSHPKFSHSVFNANPKCDEDGVDLSFNKGRRFEKHYSNTDSMETTATSLESMSHTSKSTKFKKCVLARLSLEPAK
jgi:hypothetical protein